ncbi:CopL family metal-binding regulatory protein [Shewanella benthica]|nr:CopL family metal-binding regulatory protein [Shewanella benthica]
MLNIGKGIILMLMLLTFVGQAYASVIMPYSMSMGMSTSTMSQHSMSQDTMEMSQDSMQDPDSAHSGMSHTMTNDEQQDCCKSVCNCAMGSCFSVALTMALPGLDITTHPLLKMSVFKMTTLNQYPSSLYRPPILA